MRARAWLVMLSFVGLVATVGCDDSSQSNATAARGATAVGPAWHSPPPVPPKRPRDTTPPHDPYADYPEDREARAEPPEGQPEVVRGEANASDEPEVKVTSETAPVIQPPVRTVSTREPVRESDSDALADASGAYELEPFQERFFKTDRATCAAVQFAVRSYRELHGAVPPDLPTFVKFLNERDVTLPKLERGETYDYDKKSGKLLIRRPTR